MLSYNSKKIESEGLKYNFEGQSSQAFHFIQRVSSWVVLHRILQYEAPQTTHLYLPQSPQTKHNFRDGLIARSARILKDT